MAVTVRLPGRTPGAARSRRSTSHTTVADTCAGRPTATVKPLVSTCTVWAAARHVLVGQAGRRPRAGLRLRLAGRAGQGCGAGRLAGRGLHGLVGDCHPPGEHQQQREQDERRGDDDQLDGGQTALRAHPQCVPHVGRSVGTVADWRTATVTHGTRAGACPVTVTVAVCGPRTPLACTPSSASPGGVGQVRACRRRAGGGGGLLGGGRARPLLRSGQGQRPRMVQRGELDAEEQQRHGERHQQHHLDRDGAAVAGGPDGWAHDRLS